MQHLVVGTSDEAPGVRDSQYLRSFLIKALHYALAQSLEDANEKTESPGRPRAVLKEGISGSVDSPNSEGHSERHSPKRASSAGFPKSSAKRPSATTRKVVRRFRIGGAL